MILSLAADMGLSWSVGLVRIRAARGCEVRGADACTAAVRSARTSCAAARSPPAGGLHMSDDKTAGGKPDRSRITLKERYEVRDRWVSPGGRAGEARRRRTVGVHHAADAR